MITSNPMALFDLIHSPELWNDKNTFTPLLTEEDYSTVRHLSDEKDVAQMLIEVFHADRQLPESTDWAKTGLQEIHEALVEASQDFPSVKPTIYFYKMNDSNKHAIEKTFGISGTASTGIILLSMHPSYSDLGKMKKCLLHEFNHVARLKHFPFFKDGTFLDWMIMEGLAETYNYEKFPNDATPPWTHSLDDDILAIWLPRIREFWSEKRNDIDGAREWFFGSDKIPKWLGYRVGFKIVQTFRRAHPTLDWRELICIPSEKFV